MTQTGWYAVKQNNQPTNQPTNQMPKNWYLLSLWHKVTFEKHSMRINLTAPLIVDEIGIY